MLLKFPHDAKERELFLKIVEIKIGEKIFGVDISKVVEIVSLKSLSKVSESDSFLIGVINVRGHVVPVVDIRSRFGIQPVGIEFFSRAIIFSFDGLQVGFLADSVQNRVLDGKKIPTSTDIEEFPPELIACVVSTGEKNAPVWCVENLITPDQKKRLEKVRQAI